METSYIEVEFFFWGGGGGGGGNWNIKNQGGKPQKGGGDQIFKVQCGEAKRGEYNI